MARRSWWRWHAVPPPGPTSAASSDRSPSPRWRPSWLAGRSADLAELAEPARASGAGAADRTIAAELTRYLQWAGLVVPGVGAAPEPWASGLRGDWRAAAAEWRKRGEPYEEALELLSGDGPDASSRGVELLRALGAAGTLRVVAAGRATG